MKADPWPVIAGWSYIPDPLGCVAVACLGSVIKGIEGAAIVGPLVTENIGAERIIANVISNSRIRVLLIVGPEVKGHFAGQSLEALWMNGINEDLDKHGKINGKILGAKGAIPYIQNLKPEHVKRFRDQVTVIHSMGLMDQKEINAMVDRNGGEDPFPEPPMIVAVR